MVNNLREEMVGYAKDSCDPISSRLTDAEKEQVRLLVDAVRELNQNQDGSFKALIKPGTGEQLMISVSDIQNNLSADVAISVREARHFQKQPSKGLFNFLSRAKPADSDGAVKTVGFVEVQFEDESGSIHSEKYDLKFESIDKYVVEDSSKGSVPYFGRQAFMEDLVVRGLHSALVNKMQAENYQYRQGAISGLIPDDLKAG